MHVRPRVDQPEALLGDLAPPEAAHLPSGEVVDQSVDAELRTSAGFGDSVSGDLPM